MLAIALSLASCKEEASLSPAEGAVEIPGSAATDSLSWTGRWNGPEGTYLDIAEKGEGYAITIANLDGPRNFEGSPVDHGIKFNRDGIDEIIREGSGKETGMKWLMDKKDCLIVTEGEGYCRD